MNRLLTRHIAGFVFSVCLLCIAAPSRAQTLSPAQQTCQALVQNAGKIASLDASLCSQVEFKVGNKTSVNGVSLIYRDFVSANHRFAPRRVLLIGGTHGDEASSVALALDWVRRIQHDRFQSFSWRVIPCLNPDGFLANPRTRMNAHGVDLNRNLPTPDWNQNAQAYWQTKTHSDKRRFPGHAAGSEPESQWIIEQINAYKPDAIVSIHAPYGLLDFDGPNTPPQKLGFLRLNALGTYPGSLGSYAGIYRRTPILTLELPHADNAPVRAQSALVWNDLLAWLESNLPKVETAEFASSKSP